jgi:preprotein translocase subunit SecF
MPTHKPFRELVKPGTNFDFIGRARLFTLISFLAVLASVGMLFVNKAWRGDYMNWSTDFKGGTEITFAFHKKGTNQPVEVGPGEARGALSSAGFEAFDVAEISWDENDRTVHGILIRTRDFGAVPRDVQEKVRDAAGTELKAIQPLKVTWSGDRLFIRSKKALDWKAAQAFLAKFDLTLRPWDEPEAERSKIAEEGTGEHEAELTVEGIDAHYRDALAQGLGGAVDVRVDNVYGVGAKAGAKLRNDGITALFYALLLVMLYLVVRFDLRYAPGAIRALIIDASVVMGVYAATWTEFSLVTVAAILTVMGYSVNDTVVIYDRIRENMRNLKDKKMARIMNISVNEMLGRTLLTNMTVFAVTLMMNIFGTGEVRNFAFAMNIAAVVGTLSSIFVAAPLALWIHNRFYERGGAASRARAARPEREPDQGDADDDDAGSDARG